MPRRGQGGEVMRKGMAINNKPFACRTKTEKIGITVQKRTKYYEPFKLNNKRRGEKSKQC